MADFDLIRTLRRNEGGKIVLLVMDGLGGMPIEPGGQTELEAASTPVLDRLAGEGTLGALTPIRPGITPGSGPAHLSLFGYEPQTFVVGRGVLEAVGVGVPIGRGDVAARAAISAPSMPRAISWTVGRAASPPTRPPRWLSA